MDMLHNVSSGGHLLGYTKYRGMFICLMGAFRVNPSLRALAVGKGGGWVKERWDFRHNIDTKGVLLSGQEIAI